ncbi:MAG: hypothetical protein GSR78_00030 [Desulfurococcales archaeon]|nr:hypothetical protein [Desulfurococcales archaeon]
MVSFKLQESTISLLLTVLLMAVMIASIVVAYNVQHLENNMLSSRKELVTMPETPKPLDPITQNSRDTLDVYEKNFINNKTLKDPLVYSLITKASGFKNISAGIVITDENGHKIGGCSGIQLTNTIWAKVKYKSIFGGEIETVEGFIDYIIACVKLDDGSIIGYMIQTKSITVTNSNNIPKNIDEDARNKIILALEKAKEHVVSEYGVTPIEYRIVGVENGILYIIAYLDLKHNDSDIYNVESVVIKFKYNNMSIIEAYKDIITIVNTNNIKNEK